MKTDKFEIIAKTFQELEDVLAEELLQLGAENIEIGRRMVSFTGDQALLYKANLCCRTALRILKPIYTFTALNTDEVYDRIKEVQWEKFLTPDQTFSIDSVVYSEEFKHSKFVTYRVKDAIADYFNEKYGKRPSVRLNNADIILNLHIAQNRCTLSLDSSGESLHKRGYRVAQNEAPLNEVLAAGMILKTGWRGESNFIDPMCGSGTLLVEAALIACNIAPGVYRQSFAFEKWKDFDEELFESIFNDDSQEREFAYKIYGSDISPRAVQMARDNVKSAGVARYVELSVLPFQKYEQAPEKGILITNPPYGERISSPDLFGLYQMIGERLKHVFKGYDAWIISYHDECFDKIGLKPAARIMLMNGALECEFRKYEIFDGKYKDFKTESGGFREKGRREALPEFKKRELAKPARGFRKRDDELFRESGGRFGKVKPDAGRRGGAASLRNRKPAETDASQRTTGASGRRNNRWDSPVSLKGEWKKENRPFPQHEKTSKERKKELPERAKKTPSEYDEELPKAFRHFDKSEKFIAFKQPSLPPSAQVPEKRDEGKRERINAKDKESDKK